MQSNSSHRGISGAAPSRRALLLALRLLP